MSEAPLLRVTGLSRSFGAVTALYFALRMIALGRLGNADWGIGLHGFRNLGGGVLSLLYPRSLIKLVNAGATRICWQPMGFMRPCGHASRKPMKLAWSRRRIRLARSFDRD